MFDFLFNPNGRVSRKGYGLGFLLPYYVLVGLPSLLLVPQNGLGIYFGLAGLFFFWPTIAVSVKRLHDLGQTGWIYPIFFIVVFLLSLYASAPFILDAMRGEVAPDAFEGLSGLGQAKALYSSLDGRLDRQIIYLVSASAGYLLSLLFLLLPGQSGDNKYGKDPVVDGMGFAD